MWIRAIVVSVGMIFLIYAYAQDIYVFFLFKFNMNNFYLHILEREVFIVLKGKNHREKRKAWRSGQTPTGPSAPSLRYQTTPPSRVIQHTSTLKLFFFYFRCYRFGLTCIVHILIKQRRALSYIRTAYYLILGLAKIRIIYFKDISHLLIALDVVNCK